MFTIKNRATATENGFHRSVVSDSTAYHSVRTVRMACPVSSVRSRGNGRFFYGTGGRYVTDDGNQS